jgi:hypothetical protein
MTAFKAKQSYERQPESTSEWPKLAGCGSAAVVKEFERSITQPPESRRRREFGAGG